MAVGRHIRAMDEAIEMVATVDIGTMWDRMLGEFLNEWARLERTGIAPAEMEREMAAFLEGLSDKPVEDLARKSAGVSYNEGRSAEILTRHDVGEVNFVVRSEILDAATCDVCATLDANVFEVGTPEYYEYMPPAKCLGGDRCRGFYVAFRE
jgi:hypothetical protein